MLSTCFSNSAVPFLATSATSTASSTKSPSESLPPLKTAKIAGINCKTSFNGKATETDAINPPKTIKKLGILMNIPKLEPGRIKILDPFEELNSN